MEKYISKSAVVAEIQGYISGYKDILSKVDEKCLKYAEGIEAKIDILQHLLSFLDTLEVKDVNSTDVFIEKAVNWLSLNMKMLMNVFDVEYDTHDTDVKDFIEDFKRYIEK